MITKNLLKFLYSSPILNKPSALKGSARIGDLFGKLDISGSSNFNDSQALQRDWELVGIDLKESCKKFEKEHASKA